MINLVEKVKLNDGEVHYSPGDDGIWQYIFKKEG